MKQYIIFDNQLKMSKGKIARLCHSAGANLMKASSFKQRWKWFMNNQTTIVMKTDKFDDLLLNLKLFKIKHFIHVDAGRTQVEPGSKCMVTFFADNVDMFNDLKLY